jgi:polysaccharide biosynthesis/export protein
MHRTALLKFLIAGSTLPLLAQQMPSASQATVDSQGPTLVYNLPSQPVGVDDLLSISVYEAPEFSRTVRVSSEGQIRLPMLKEKISVLGKLPNEIETAVAAELSSEGLLVDPVVTVSVADYKSRPITVVGAVKSPTTFQALPGTTLIDALTRAQGLTDDAGTEIILTKTIAGASAQSTIMSQRIPIKEVLGGEKSAKDISLTGGETIRVPESPKVFVMGNVLKPGSISLHDTSGETTVLKAVALSQGLTPYASKTAYIFRRDGSTNQSGIPVELAKILDRKTPDVLLQPADILYIPDNKGKRMTLGSLEKVLGVGQAATPALIYTTH